MNNFPSPQTPQTPQPLPSPDERDLPAGRHHLLKEHLMREIEQSAADTAPEDRTAPEDHTAPARRRWLRPAIAGPATAGVLALTVVVGLAVAGSGEQEGEPGGSPTYAHVPQAGKDQRDGAPALLENIAEVAAKERPDRYIRDDQFVFVESLVSYAESQEGKPPEFAPLHLRRVWQSVDGTRRGLDWEQNRKYFPDKHTTEPEVRPGKPVSKWATHYRNLAALPTDTDAMLKWLRTAAASSSQGGDQQMFVLVGDLLGESMAPPEVNAALYRAAARIPGVVVVPDAVDARGNKGVAIARVDTDNGIRDEWIFDRENKSYLGERSVVVKDDGSDFEVGDVVGVSSVIRRAVVNKAGQQPA